MRCELVGDYGIMWPEDGDESRFMVVTFSVIGFVRRPNYILFIGTHRQCRQWLYDKGVRVDQNDQPL